MAELITVNFHTEWQDVFKFEEMDKDIFEDLLSWINAKLVFVNEVPKIVGLKDGKEDIDMSSLKFRLDITEKKVGLWQMDNISIMLPDNLDPVFLGKIESDIRLIKEQVGQCNSMLRNAFFKKGENRQNFC